MFSTGAGAFGSGTWPQMSIVDMGYPRRPRTDTSKAHRQRGDGQGVPNKPQSQSQPHQKKNTTGIPEFTSTILQQQQQEQQQRQEQSVRQYRLLSTRHLRLLQHSTFVRPKASTAAIGNDASIPLSTTAVVAFAVDSAPPAAIGITDKDAAGSSQPHRADSACEVQCSSNSNGDSDNSGNPTDFVLIMTRHRSHSDALHEATRRTSTYTGVDGVHRTIEAVLTSCDHEEDAAMPTMSESNTSTSTTSSSNKSTVSKQSTNDSNTGSSSSNVKNSRGMRSILKDFVSPIKRLFNQGSRSAQQNGGGSIQSDSTGQKRRLSFGSQSSTGSRAAAVSSNTKRPLTSNSNDVALSSPIMRSRSVAADIQMTLPSASASASASVSTSKQLQLSIEQIETTKTAPRRSKSTGELHSKPIAQPPQSQPQSQLQPQSNLPVRASTNQSAKYSSHELKLRDIGRQKKTIGRGTGGVVRLMHAKSVLPPYLQNRKDAAPNTSAFNSGGGSEEMRLYAVKEFRPRRSDESRRVYYKKLTAEFCIGSSLHHENIIETIDLIFEGDRVYELLEYCPYDLFSHVEASILSRPLDYPSDTMERKPRLGPPQIACLFRQLMNGVAYLHSLGIAHRDLKLDNCVLTADGVLKIIDFGCAMVCRQPYSSSTASANVELATGICGSDPFIAPECFLPKRYYDPMVTDIWSAGIIYMCMVMARFPWRLAIANDDPSYSQYVRKLPESKSGVMNQLRMRDQPDGAIELLKKIVEPSPKLRATASQVLDDAWLKRVDYCRASKLSCRHFHFK